jgi:hypothetical protein
MSTLIQMVSSLFPTRVQSVVLATGRTLTMPKNNTGRVLIGMQEALTAGTDVYAFSGRLLDLQQAGEFTVSEGKVVDAIRLEIAQMAESGVVFTATRADASAGQLEVAALRATAKMMKSAGVQPSAEPAPKATRRRRTAK